MEYRFFFVYKPTNLLALQIDFDIFQMVTLALTL